MLTVARDTYRITASRADDHKVRFTVLNASGVAYNVSANTFKFTCKRSVDDPLASAVFQKTSPAASGIDLTLAASGIVDVNLVPADTSGLQGGYFYDLEMTEGGLVYTLQQGVLQIVKDVSTVGGAVTAPALGYQFLTALYLQDTVVTTNYYKLTMTSGLLDVAGPSPVWPF